VQFFNAYIRAETLETAMLSTLKSPPPEFSDVVKAHFRRAWHALVRPDLLAWADRHDLAADGGGSGNDPGWQPSQSQIHRLQWFRGALGAGNYKKMILASVAKMDEMVAALGGALPASETGGGVVAADIRDETAGGRAGGGGKSDRGAGVGASAKASGSGGAAK